MQRAGDRLHNGSMIEPGPACKYRAFLSYSHRDRKFGEWLHKRVENWPVPRELSGRATASNPVPSTLRPIFRDRDDLAASHSLQARISEALAQSANLIVICSPSAAKSPYVNEEIRQFKAMKGPHRVLAIIADGEPGHPEFECFPPALRFALGPQGQMTDKREEPIAADARDVGDGRDLAALKVIAGLLGVSLDEVRKREAIAQRRRYRIMAATAAAMGVLALTATGLGLLAEKRRAEAQENFETALSVTDELGFKLVQTLRDEHKLPIAYVQEVTNAAGTAYERLEETVGDSNDMRMRKVNLLMERANNYEMAGEQPAQEIAAGEALALMKQVAESDPSQPSYLVSLAIAHDKMGAALAKRGETVAARVAFRDSLAVLARLPEQPAWAEHRTRFSCVAYYRLGTVLPQDGLPREQLEQNLTAAKTSCDAWAGLDASDPARRQGVDQMLATLADGLKSQ